MIIILQIENKFVGCGKIFKNTFSIFYSEATNTQKPFQEHELNMTTKLSQMYTQ